MTPSTPTMARLRHIKFLPGHQKRILKFVEELKQERASDRKRQAKPTGVASKRRKSLQDSDSSSSSGSVSVVNQADVARKVCCLIAKWQRSQKDVKLRELKEHEHFDVKVSVELNVSILCKMCGKLSVLGKAKGCVMISSTKKDVLNNSNTWLTVKVYLEFYTTCTY